MDGYNSNSTDQKCSPEIQVTETTSTEKSQPEGCLESDIVIDFAGQQIFDLSGLTMLLTAQQIADSEKKQIWLMDTPERTWILLKALGLNDLFEFLPPLRDQLN